MPTKPTQGPSRAFFLEEIRSIPTFFELIETQICKNRAFITGERSQCCKVAIKMYPELRSTMVCLVSEDRMSETGRLWFWRARFQKPNSVSFLALAEFPGESSVFFSASHLCVEANSPSFPQNSLSSPQNSVSSLFRNRHRANGVGRGGGQAVLDQILTRFRLKSG